MNNSIIWMIAIFVITGDESHATFTNIFDGFNDLYRSFTRNPHEGLIKDTKSFKSKYDFIVIGAGSGGSVVANRLTENPKWDVLLLEAGKDETFISDIPLSTGIGQVTSLNWGYTTEHVTNACLGLENRVCKWPRGKVLGGTSVLNFLVYTRGNKLDYDSWEAMGNPGWSYNDVLPYFIKSENIAATNLSYSPYHGSGGYLDVQYSSYTSPMHEAFKVGGAEMGYDYNDPNGENNLGFSKTLATMRNGRRCSASRAFLEPIRLRKNFHVSKLSRVTKILIDPVTKRAFGVEFVKNNKKYTVKAKKEVILSAGTIGSAHLLMLSGIGPKRHLESFGIPVLKDSMVGYNLQDHVSVSGIVFLVNDSVTVDEATVRNPRAVFDYLVRGKGPFTIPGGADGLAFVKTKYSYDVDDRPDIELVLGAGSLSSSTPELLRLLTGITYDFYNRMFRDIKERYAFNIYPILLSPHSRGRISLRSPNPFHWPVMQPNYFEDPRDLHVLREGVKLTVELTKTSGFKKFNTTIHRRHCPGCEHLVFGSDSYWECAIRQITTTLSHQVGTAKMGPPWDPTSVVDPRLKVIGIDALRVVDASIMPTIPTGHTNAVVFMIGEKASDMIKEDWGL